MGEQAQAQDQAQTQRHHDSAAAATTTTSAAVTVYAPPPQTSSSSAAPSKIPFRPRKIRKLSPDPNTSQIVAAGTTTASAKSTRNKIVVQYRDPAVPIPAARSLLCEGELDTALRHLRAADPLLSPLIDIYPPPTFSSFRTPFLALTRSILFQQLASKAGASIYTRFIALCGGEAGVVPETVLALTPHQLRQIGISGRKASYLHDLARKYQNGILSDSAIVNMDDKSLFTMLTMVNGIGSWSVHMFMINSLHRPDVLPINDLTVRKGVQILYNLEDLPRPSQMDQLCEKWRPYRSVGAWYMWRFSETKGAPASQVAAASVSLQQRQHQEEQHQLQPQLLDPINSILNLGACGWEH